LNDRLESLDNLIINAVQSDFPVEKRPFAALAEKIGIGEELLIERLRALKDSGEVRRFGAIFDSRRLGYVSTLVGLRIPDENRIPEVAAAVSAYPEVTHNYQREDSYNLWFTLIAENDERIDGILKTIAALEPVAEVRNLPALALYKINAQFRTIAEQDS
jgi:DNA-binding Lrp family transcriptional regulator